MKIVLKHTLNYTKFQPIFNLNVRVQPKFKSISPKVVQILPIFSSVICEFKLNYELHLLKVVQIPVEICCNEFSVQF